MNNTFIWWNLPAQLKDKLDIDTNWFTLLSKVNILLRELEGTKQTLYEGYYNPNYKVGWFNLIEDLERILIMYEEDIK